MTEIILARHGQTEWNVGEIYRGRIDIGLDEVGLKQAELLGKYLSDLKLDAIHSSSLRRALHTANTIARYQEVDVEVANGLVDFDYGEWQGLPDTEVRRLYPALHNEWHSNPHMVKMPSGESLADVRERAVAVVDDVVSRYEGSVVLVTHRVVNKVLICCLLGLDNSHFWNIKQDVCGITIFSYSDGRFILTRHNDASCLREIGRQALSDF
jgi:broad specificity phosphatase PhoE